MITYNETIRQLVLAGEEWFKKNPGARPRMARQHRIAGVAIPENRDARRLLAALDEKADELGDVTGAQIQQAARVAIKRYNAALMSRHPESKWALGTVLAVAISVIICTLVLGWILVSCDAGSR